MKGPRWTPTDWTAHKDPIPSAPERWCVYANGAPIGLRMPAECIGPHAKWNARLIAAAPELYEAVEAALVRFDEAIHGRKPSMPALEYSRMLKAALAKAVSP